MVHVDRGFPPWCIAVIVFFVVTLPFVTMGLASARTGIRERRGEVRIGIPMWVPVLFVPFLLAGPVIVSGIREPSGLLLPIPLWVFLQLGMLLQPTVRADRQGLRIVNRMRQVTTIPWADVADIRYERRPHRPMVEATRYMSYRPGQFRRWVPYRGIGVVYRWSGPPVLLDATEAVAPVGLLHEPGTFGHANSDWVTMEPSRAARRCRAVVQAWRDMAPAPLARPLHGPAHPPAHLSAPSPGSVPMPPPLPMPMPMSPPLPMPMPEAGWDPAHPSVATPAARADDWNQTEIDHHAMAPGSARAWTYKGGQPTFRNTYRFIPRAVGLVVGIVFFVIWLVVFVGLHGY